MASQQPPSPQLQPPPPPSPQLQPPPPPSPPPSARDLAVALARPAGLWSSLIAHLPEGSRPRSHLVGGRRCRRRRRTGLPLPISRDHGDSARINEEKYNSFAILEDIVHHTLCTMHLIETNLLYWDQYTHQGTDLRKICHMVFQRGPTHFIHTVIQSISRFCGDESPLTYLKTSASDMVSAHRTALTNTQRYLASFLAEVYFEVDEHREGLTESSDKSLRTLLVVLNTIFSKLEAAIGSAELMFERLPEVDVESAQWKEISTHATFLIYQNLQKLEDTVSSHISSGAIGLSVCSLWLLRHSSFMGSPDMSNWIQDAKESMTRFWDRRVEKPIISIRDEVVRTLDRSSRHAAVEQDVKLTEQSLRRMLIAFCEETSTEKLPHDTPVQIMLEIVMKRYEEETKNPINNLFRGEIARAMLIQIHKLKLDLKEAMLELDQILKANEINFAILAALPVLVHRRHLAQVVLGQIRLTAAVIIKQCRRSRIAPRHRWAILNEIDRLLNEFEKDKAERSKFGLAIYSADRLYGSIQLVAKGTNEWASVSEELFALARPDLQKERKLPILARLKESYECLQRPLLIE